LPTEVEDTSSSEDEQSNGDEINQQFNQLKKVLLLFIVFWQFSFNISNAAITCLLKFFRYFLKVLGDSLSSVPLITFSEKIPISIKTCYKSCFSEDINFESYVVCPTCNSVYNYDDCVNKRANGVSVSKRCKSIAYPNHPHQSQRQPCSAILLKKVRTKKKYILRPHLVYPYNFLQNSIEQLCKRESFLIECEKWRNRTIPDGFLCDIYDGLLWKDFYSIDGYNFLSAPHCFLLTLNTDWFQPFDRTTYSVGVLYLTIQSLPRHLRYRMENIIIVGIIPGPKEPKKHMNSFLAPLVYELQEAWESGFPVNVNGCIVNIKLALSCIACDIPATRKVCGFLSHSAKLGCNKCLKEFPSVSPGCNDYSGFNDEPVLRSEEQHRDAVKEVQKASTKSSEEKKQSDYGVRYSVLLELAYFDPIRFVAIDFMHNMFLGTAKRCFDIWIDDKILTKQDIKVIENRIELFRLPCDVGRIPSHISAYHGAFTANQWKNWITIYSAVVLKGVLEPQHLQCWLLFVQVCTILCRNILRCTDVESAGLFIKHFCLKFQSLYGDARCTINMHLHTHLVQTFKDFGPPHSTWCFAFERFNGIIGSYHTNRKEIENQLMKKFSQAQKLYNMDLPFEDNLLSIISHRYCYEQQTNSCSTLYLMRMAQEQLSSIANFACGSGIASIPPYYEHVFTATELQWLTCIYNQLYPEQTGLIVSPFYRMCGRIKLTGDLIGSEMRGPNNITSSVIMAFWPSKGSSLQSTDYSTKNVGVVQFFVIHHLTHSGADNEKHIFAYVKWKQLHRNRNHFGKSATVCEDLFEPDDACCFLPIQRIACRCAFAVMPVNFSDITETVFIACPVELNYIS